MTVADITAVLDLIASKAPALVAAGLRGPVQIGEVRFVLADPPGESPIATAPQEAVTDDALNDPATHGLFGEDAARRMPRRRREPLLPVEVG